MASDGESDGRSLVASRLPEVARSASLARLRVALSVGAMFADFLVDASITGGGTPSVTPSKPKGGIGEVSLVGHDVGTLSRNPSSV